MTQLLQTVPRAHQLAAFEKSKDAADFGLLMEAGTGKTLVAIHNAAYLFAKGKIDTLLVEAPNGVHRKWLEEVTKHLHPDVPRAMAYYRAGCGKGQAAAFDQVVAYRGGLRVLAYNLESLSMDAGTKHALFALGKRAAMLVFDESQNIKTPSSKRTRNAYKLGDKALYRRILTGTPVGLGLHDLYSQFRFLDWRIIGCQTFTAFKARYCQIGGFDGRQIVGYLNVPELLARIAPFVFEANKKDCLDLPPETWVTREVELSPEQRKHYKEIRDQFVSELNSHTLDATQAGTRMLRLRQILSGYFPTPDDGGLIDLPCPRLEACVDLVEEAARSKVVVWCHFQRDVVRVMERLKSRGIGALAYYGGISPTQRDLNLAKWKTEDAIIALVATPATGGVGLDMVEAPTDITYSHNYAYIEWTQKNARIHRSGQTEKVTHFNMVARGTADTKMLKVVQERGNVAELVKNLDRKALIAILSEAA